MYVCTMENFLYSVTFAPQKEIDTNPRMETFNQTRIASASSTRIIFTPFRFHVQRGGEPSNIIKV